MRDAYAPLVWQCRYSGIEVPDRLWRHVEMGRNRKYSENQAEHMVEAAGPMRSFDQWADAFAHHVEKKGKVEPGKYRAFGHRSRFHLFESLRIKWRGVRMALGRPRPGSSPAKQQELNLNRDATIWYKKGEGAKLRDGHH
jgi:hypothetical protein